MQVVRLHQGFATGKSDSASRFVIEGDIALDLGNHLGGGHFATHNLARFGIAGLDAGTAESALLIIGDDLISIQPDGALLAGNYTGLASQAAVVAKYPFRSPNLTLWIVAPPAPQGASFEEYGGTDARPIVDGEPSDIKDVSSNQLIL